MLDSPTGETMSVRVCQRAPHISHEGIARAIGAAMRPALALLLALGAVGVTHVAEAVEAEVTSDNEFLTLTSEADRVYYMVKPGTAVIATASGPGRVFVIVRANQPRLTLGGGTRARFLNLEVRDNGKVVAQPKLQRSTMSRDSWNELDNMMPSSPGVLALDLTAGAHTIEITSHDGDEAGGAVAFSSTPVTLAGAVALNASESPAVVAREAPKAAGRATLNDAPAAAAVEGAPVRPMATATLEQRQRFPYQAVGWSTFAAGVVLIGVGGYFNAQSQGLVDDANAQFADRNVAYVDTLADGESKWNVAQGLYIGGGIIAATGLGLAIYDIASQRRPTDLRGEAPRVKVLPGAGTLAIRGEF